MLSKAAAPPPAAATPTTKKVVIPFPEESENVTRWIVDQNFRHEQERLKIPFGTWPFARVEKLEWGTASSLVLQDAHVGHVL